MCINLTKAVSSESELFGWRWKIWRGAERESSYQTQTFLSRLSPSVSFQTCLGWTGVWQVPVSSASSSSSSSGSLTTASTWTSLSPCDTTEDGGWKRRDQLLTQDWINSCTKRRKRWPKWRVTPFQDLKGVRVHTLVMMTGTTTENWQVSLHQCSLLWYSWPDDCTTVQHYDNCFFYGRLCTLTFINGLFFCTKGTAWSTVNCGYWCLLTVSCCIWWTLLHPPWFTTVRDESSQELC